MLFLSLLSLSKSLLFYVVVNGAGDIYDDGVTIVVITIVVVVVFKV